METKDTSPAFVAYRISGAQSANPADFKCLDERILICELFGDGRLAGSFFSCVYQGALRIHIVLRDDNDCYNDELNALIYQSMRGAGVGCGKVWFKAGNLRAIASVGREFALVADDEPFFYDSTEYIMRRELFHPAPMDVSLEARPYEAQHMDRYLDLLHSAMAFKIPPHDYIGEKARYMQSFEHMSGEGAFQAFWLDGELVGLYWLEGTEIDHLAVSPHWQRAGYGAMMLTHAIQTVLCLNPSADHAVLYCVGWNHKAQRFYRKYGMEVNAHYRVPYTEPSEG